MADELSKLSPEERLQKLKEKKKKQEEELKEAKALIKDTELELKDRKEFKEKVPIPQVAVLTTEGLSEEEKQIVAVQKGLKGNENQDEESLEEKTRSDDEDSLEDAVRREQRDNPLDPMTQAYIEQRSKEPMVKLYHEMQSLYGEAKAAGYMSPEMQQRFADVSSAIEQKVEAVEQGDYSLSETAERAASATDAIRQSLGLMYDGAKKQENKDPSNWYQ